WERKGPGVPSARRSARRDRSCHRSVFEAVNHAVHAKSMHPDPKARNETLRATRHYGRAFWKRWTGYQARSRMESRMRSLKALGERISARDPDRQTAEIHIRVVLINRFNALGTAEVVRVA
ncbi:hypothetical protein ACTXGA_04980, partial [Antarctobacter jejuensis]